MQRDAARRSQDASRTHELTPLAPASPAVVRVCFGEQPHSCYNTCAMPKLYEYMGIIVLFYSNEHEPIHVHGKCQGRESRAELIIRDGQIVDTI